MKYFEPRMTAFIQPCDAGIIGCFKKIYRRLFNAHAIDLDEAGESELYKINLLDAMSMAKEAWDSVTSETISRCWNHTQIQS